MKAMFKPFMVLMLIGMFMVACRFATSATEVPDATDAPTETSTFVAIVIPTETETPAATVAPTASETPVQIETPTTLPEILIESTQVSPMDGMVQVYVPAGEFQMGSTEGESDEMPVHTVYLDAFWIDRTEVTNAMFALFTEDTNYETDAEKADWSYVFTGSDWDEISGADWQHPDGPSSGLSGLENHPVVQVSWNDALAYCSWAGRRLPTEAEWEKAARGQDGRAYPWGNESPNNRLLNYNQNEGNTIAVGSYASGASPYGAMDLAGNVVEWVNDWYSETYYSSSPYENPAGPSAGENHTLRGGSWNDPDYFVRSTIRFLIVPNYGDNGVGFRCAVSTEN